MRGRPGRGSSVMRSHYRTCVYPPSRSHTCTSGSCTPGSSIGDVTDHHPDHYPDAVAGAGELGERVVFGDGSPGSSMISAGGREGCTHRRVIMCVGDPLPCRCRRLESRIVTNSERSAGTVGPTRTVRRKDRCARHSRRWRDRLVHWCGYCRSARQDVSSRGVHSSVAAASSLRSGLASESVHTGWCRCAQGRKGIGARARRRGRVSG